MARSARTRPAPSQDRSRRSPDARFAYGGLDRTLHEKARLGILTCLALHPDGVRFGELRRLCALTGGNLSRHLDVLHEAGFVEIFKAFERRRPRTLCRLSHEGQRRFRAYLDELARVVDDASGAVEAAGPPVPPPHIPVVLPANNASEWTGPTGTNTFLIRGTVPTLVDAGIGDPSHVAAIEQALGGAALAVILVTHDHPDHAGGIPALVARWPGARVRGARWSGLGDGEIVPAGDGRLRAIHTPGHAPDHFCFADEAGDVYCGDLAREGGTVVIPARGGDLAAYLTSLGAIAALRPRRLLPGHGPIVENPAALISRYLAHRRARERQILDALASGCTTIEHVVARIYKRLTPALMRAAGESVLAHLRKLSSEGRVAERSGEWSLTDH